MLDETARAAGVERRATADLLHLLAEVDRRRLFLGLGYSSLFTYCTQALRLSEPAAYTRITAARAAARWPTILPRLAAGDVTLTAVTLLATHLTDESHQALLDSVSHKSKREVERLVAGLNPKPDVASLLRRLPAPAAEAPAILPVVEAEALLRSAPEPSTRPTPPPPPRAVVAPLSTDRYLLRVTLSDAAHTDLERIRELLRHSIPTGDPSAIVARALAVQRQHLERTRHGAPRRPKTRVRLGSRSSRHVPAAVRREVWHRDEGRCAFIGTDGRCRETGFLEFHHVDPFARGGPTTVENVALRCRAHNVHEAERDFGARSSSHRRGAATSSREFCPDRAEQVGRPALGDPRCGA